MGGDEEAVGRGEWREGKTEWGEMERVSRDPRTPLVFDLSPAFKMSQDQVSLGGSISLKKENSREFRWLGLQSWLCCLLSLSSHLTCVNLCFLICEVEILRVPVSQDCCEGENRASMLSSEHNIDTWQKLGKCLVVEWITDIHWKDWCWSWSSYALATWCEDPTHWTRPWCWERLRAGGEETKDEMAGWHHWLNGHDFE